MNRYERHNAERDEERPAIQPDDWHTNDGKAKRRQEQMDADTTAAGQLRDQANARAEAAEEIGTRQHMPVATVHTPPPAIAPPSSTRAPAARVARQQQQEASEKRRATVAAAKQQTEAEMAAAAAAQLPELDRDVEALVARYNCGRVIDAAWAASARLFKRA